MLASDISRKDIVRVEKSRGRIKLYTPGKKKPIAENDKYIEQSKKYIKKTPTPYWMSDNILSLTEIQSFFVMISKKMSKYIKNSPGYNVGEVPPLLTPRKRFKKQKYLELDFGEYFYTYDIDSAYWQAAYKMEVINKETYNKYISQYFQYKTLMQICWGMACNDHKSTYIYKNENIIYPKSCLDKKLAGRPLEIECDKSQFKQIYANIRHFSENTIADILKELNPENVIEWTRDSITISKNAYDDAADLFLESGWHYKVQVRRKIANNFFRDHKGEYISVR